MKTITPDEMRQTEERSEEFGVSRLLLMENAGRSVADHLKTRFGELNGRRIVVVAGLGNNGGDGFVCARHLAGFGAQVVVVLLGRPNLIRTPEASSNWRVLERMNRTVTLMLVADEASLGRLREALIGADGVVDAIFGTGIRGPLREPFAPAIRLLNGSRGYRVAVDVPSGVDPLTGDVHEVAVAADVTITFHRLKPGLLKAADHTGTLVVAPIGIPPEAEAGPAEREGPENP